MPTMAPQPRCSPMIVTPPRTTRPSTLALVREMTGRGETKATTEPISSKAK
eukprot:CAMPEP_0184506378 /NCGR_PEP_ID=MMETSP0113_2-20130426/53468_1 /TAXON_ID=91329 /ORGANISM="Norrisiella sphaerica, Strain BC52" /LENGTH=50 /DNA_ID=CAMNT_0026896093 /DNA_START=789 /DNA_END=941 /DNA_ORIENTATION=-